MKYLVVDDEPLILKDIARTIAKVVEPNAEIFTVDNYKEALVIADREQPYVAFLDVDMPEMNGLELSKRIVEISPNTNIIFVTGYEKYSFAAWKTSASAFLLKPINKKDLEEAMQKLRKPYTQKKLIRDGLFFRCFGNFEIFFDGIPVKFERRQSKEFLAYLIDRQGAKVPESEIRAVLWEEDEDSDAKKSYVRTLASDIRKTLEQIGEVEIFRNGRGVYSIDMNQMHCDYYEYERGTIPRDSFRGDYMTQYSWAELTAAQLNKNWEE